jgi:predicted glycoside hydrolase/deacetylase ChbG (UPF0249 family)
VLVEIAGKLGVPLRHSSREVQYCGRFFGQTGKGSPFPDGINVETFVRILADLPPGVTELGCHPGDGTDADLGYRGERAEEVRVLCDPRVRAAITVEGIELRSFNRDPMGSALWPAHSALEAAEKGWL